MCFRVGGDSQQGVPGREIDVIQWKKLHYEPNVGCIRCE